MIIWAISLEQWNVLSEYFLSYLPEHEKKTVVDNKRYDSIKLNLSSMVSKARVSFIFYLCRAVFFNKFLTWFQQEGSLIHLLYQELSDLYRTLLLCFLTPNYVGDKQGNDLLSIDFTLAEKQVNNKKVQIGKK